MDFRGREREVPIPHHGLWRWERGVAVVDCGDGESGVSTEDQSGQVDGNRAFDCERDGEDDHQGFVGHWVNHATGDGLQFPASGYPAVYQVGDARVGEEGERILVVVVHE